MTKLGRRERIAVGLWVIIAVVAGNGLYDLLLARDTQTYLFKSAMHSAGLGPPVDVTATLDAAVAYAAWVSTLWAALLFAAGCLTIYLTRHAPPHPRLERNLDAQASDRLA
jgi:hypothetical protein